MADETSDVGHHEQMAVAVRYFDANLSKPVEQFIGIRRLTAVDANTIFNSLTNKIAQFNINWKSVIAVCFDGASSMSGKCNSVQSKVKDINPCVMYVHCYGHRLNLALVHSLGNKNRVVFDFFWMCTANLLFHWSKSSEACGFEKIVNETSSR